MFLVIEISFKGFLVLCDSSSDVGAFKNNAGHVPEKPSVATVSRKKSIDTPKSECALNDLPYFLKDGNREMAFRILKEIKQVSRVSTRGLKVGTNVSSGSVLSFKEGVFYIYRTKGPEKNTYPYEMAVFNETTVEYLPIKSSSYDHFSIEPNSELVSLLARSQILPLQSSYFLHVFSFSFF